MKTKTETKIVPIAQINLDKRFYPRVNVNAITSYRYAKSMEAGAVFPPVTLAALNGKLILVDGAHRIAAEKINKKTHITAEIIYGLGEQQIYLEAIKRNINHGLQFSSFERTRMALQLGEWNFSKEQISEIIRIPVVELQNFVAKRMVRISNNTGEEMEEVAIKSPLRHLAGTELFENPIQQGVFTNRTQVNILEELIALMKNGWLDTTSEAVMEKLNIAFKLMKQYITEEEPKRKPKKKV